MTMLVSPQNPNQDIYVISEPSFTTPNQCLAFVDAEVNGLVAKANIAFEGRPVENIYCIEQNKLQELLTEMEKAQGTSI